MVAHRPTTPSPHARMGWLRIVLVPGLAFAHTAPTEPGPQPVVISDVDLGAQQAGENEFSATVRNTSPAPVLAVIDLRAMPGMWFGPAHQHQVGVELEAGESRRVETTYSFFRLSPEAVLRLRWGPGSRAESGRAVLGEAFDERLFQVGEVGQAARDLESNFQVAREGPLAVYAFRGSYASPRIEHLLAERLSAIQAIQGVLGVEPPETIRLVLYPDGATKTEQTGHQGDGWAFGTTIVEVYNESVQLDPYHEVAHILARSFGSLPSAFDEGVATYMSERLGADALQYLGSPGEPVDLVACRALQEGTGFALVDLVELDIGTPESRPRVSYPQAASVVKFIAEHHGLEALRRLLGALGRLEVSAADAVDRAVRSTLGSPLSVLEQRWKATLAGRCSTRA